MIEGDGDAKSRKVKADEIARIIDARKDNARQLRVELGADDIQDEELRELRNLIADNPGPCQTRIQLAVDAEDGYGEATLDLPEGFAVDPTNELLMSIDRLFGRKVVELQSSNRY
ncbi:MAG: hypothetical protein ABEN55_09130 [Bradymonadaceae bacterium]